MLYPDRELPGFLRKNCLSPDQVQGSATIAALVESGDRTLVVQDENDAYHFNGSFRNARDVEQALAHDYNAETMRRLRKGFKNRSKNFFTLFFSPKAHSHIII